MSKNLFKGFNEIKADDHLVAKTKNKMLNLSSKTKPAFSVRKPVVAAVSVIAVSAILAVALMNGAGGKFEITAKAQDLMHGITPRSVNVSGAISDNFLNSTQNFSVNLFKKSYKSGKNALVSPTSACLALGMTANGASGSTRTAFQNVLGKYGMTIDDLNKAYKAYADELTKKSGSTTLNISNSIWFRSDFKANKTFLQNNADFFGATAEKLDFNDKNAVNVINDWVKDKTGGKINKIVDKFGGDDVMHLVNALYFEAKWQYAFDKDSKAYSGDFNFDNGGTAKVTYMKLENSLDYVKAKNETAVLLPYDDGRFAMLCVLPDKGVKLNDYINSMTDKTISNLVGKMKEKGVSLTFPKFKATASIKLNDELKAIGLGQAFDMNADFSKMGECKGNLYISCVRHKTYLKVDEKETEAAAATDVEMKCTAAAPTEITEKIDFNRPFVYAVIDTRTNLPLFFGAMENPSCT